MAQSSGSFSGSIRNGYQKLIVEWSSSQNVETNKSTITAKMYLYSVGAIYIGERNNSTTIDGTSLPYTSPTISQSSGFTILVGTVSKEIEHDSYGNKTFSMSSSFFINADLGGQRYYYINAYSDTIELPNIPRASTITVNDANIGSSTTININKKVTSFTTELYWRVQGDNNWTYIDTTSQYSYGWTVPTSLYDRMSTITSIVCEFKAITKSGSTTIGNKTTTARFTATGYPSIDNYTITDVNQNTIDLTEDSSCLVKYQSTARISVEASGINNSTVTRVAIKTYDTETIYEATYDTQNDIWKADILNVSTNKFYIYVYDSRNRYIYELKTVNNFIDYIPLTTNGTITRNQPTDGKVNIQVNGNYFNGSFSSNNDNSLTIKYRYVEYGGDISQESWITVTPTITNNTYSVTTQISNIDYTKQYEFQLQANDLLDTQTIIGIQVPKGKPVFDWGEDFFNVNGTLKVNDNAILTNLFPVGSIYMSATLSTAQQVGEALGGTWVAWGSGRVPVGVDTNDTNFNSVEKQGGSPDLQQHSHTGTTNGAGGHNHQVGADDDGAGGSSWSTIHKAGTSGAGRLVDTSWVGDHTHTFTTNNAGSGNSGNLQPYITCYMYKRIA